MKNFLGTKRGVVVIDRDGVGALPAHRAYRSSARRMMKS
jgi:hypothetical protein